MIRIKLRQRREELNLSYKDVAGLANISKPGYWQIENGKRGVSYNTAISIARALNTTPDSIFLDIKLTKTEQKFQTTS